jgi:hypothetical protein
LRRAPHHLLRHGLALLVFFHVDDDHWLVAHVDVLTRCA